jgi:nitroreductase
MTPDELLTTTRSVRRRLDFDRPVPRELILECLEIAVQAPTGGNRQTWQWLIVTDPDKKRFIGERYRKAFEAYNASGRPQYTSEARNAALQRVVTSSVYLAERMVEVPAMVLALIEGRVTPTSSPSTVAALYGSIIPAVWSFQLAARARGLGTVYTTLHLRYEEEVARELGIPYDRYTQAALLPVGYFKGESFKPAERIPLDQIVHWDRW